VKHIGVSEDFVPNIMLVTNAIHKTPTGGRELLCKLNYNILKDLYNDRCIVFELSKNYIIGIKSIINAFRGYIDGLSPESVALALQQIQAQNVNKIFVDGSNLGKFVKVVKTKFPEIQIYTFFHNVEARFFWGAFKQNPSPHSLAVLATNYLAERKSIAYADNIICLNNRDSALLKKLYGRLSDYITPMSIQDKYTDRAFTTRPKTKFALFVGGDFYANFSGIKWFVKNVAPYITIQIFIVGRGMKNFRKELEISNNVKVIGEVDSLEKWYLESYFVIAPIFDGSGMKTKIAEALMFGKKIIGTPEAFSGYEEISAEVGHVCTNADDFIDAINSADKMVDCLFDRKLREIYKSKYSFSAAKDRLKRILNA